MTISDPPVHGAPLRPANVVHAALLDQLSFELIPMKKSADKIGLLPSGSRVTVTASPKQGPEATLELAALISAAGHQVIPHLSARSMASKAQLEDVVAQLDSLQISEVFVIAGDGQEPAGPWFDAMQFLEDLVQVSSGLNTVGFAAYPDGHAFIDSTALSTALHRKQQIVLDAGLAGYVSTQMCFEAEQIMSWLGKERRQGFILPVHLGVPGAVERKKLLTMGMRLGVGASLRYLKKNKGIVGSLLGTRFDPNELISQLVPLADALGVSAVHCFTFNQVEATVAWQEQARRSLLADTN